METQSTERVRLAYERPVLEDLGSLSELTAGPDGGDCFDGSSYSASSSTSS